MLLLVRPNIEASIEVKLITVSLCALTSCSQKCLKLQNLGFHQRNSWWTNSWDNSTIVENYNTIWFPCQGFPITNYSTLYSNNCIWTYRRRKRVRRPIDEGIAPFSILLDKSLNSVVGNQEYPEVRTRIASLKTNIIRILCMEKYID